MYVYACMFAYVNAHMRVGTLRDQKRVPGLLELEFQAAVSHLMCVLGTGLGWVLFKSIKPSSL